MKTNNNSNEFKSDYEFMKDMLLEGNVKRVFNAIDTVPELDANGRKSLVRYTNMALNILKMVAKYGNGFVVDICEKAIENNSEFGVRRGDFRHLSDKQKWCVAYAAVKLTAEQIDEYIAEEMAKFAALDAELEAEETANAEEENEENENSEENNENNENNENMEATTNNNELNAEDVKWVDAYQATGNVFIHLANGKTIHRIYSARDIVNIRRVWKNEDDRTREFVKLFNKTYSRPERREIPRDRFTNAELRMYELAGIEATSPVGLGPEAKKELRKLENGCYFEH